MTKEMKSLPCHNETKSLSGRLVVLNRFLEKCEKSYCLLQSVECNQVDDGVRKNISTPQAHNKTFSPPTKES